MQFESDALYTEAVNQLSTRKTCGEMIRRLVLSVKVNVSKMTNVFCELILYAKNQKGKGLLTVQSFHQGLLRTAQTFSLNFGLRKEEISESKANVGRCSRALFVLNELISSPPFKKTDIHTLWVSRRGLCD